ncbi:hypothetical protein DXG01_013813 [Tephrocybe rancida]|nr:hypothetical protein DXG01_013813 [Tephrocybe rancida]
MLTKKPLMSFNQKREDLIFEPSILAIPVTVLRLSFYSGISQSSVLYCQATKKRVGSALENLRDVWQHRKQRRLNAELPDSELIAKALPSEEEKMIIDTCQDSSAPSITVTTATTAGASPGLDTEIEASQYVATVSAQTASLESGITGEDLPLAESSGAPPSLPISNIEFKMFVSPSNIFGLSRIYRGKELPTHDPEELISLCDLNDIYLKTTASKFSSSSISPYFPYPNKNSFALGNWFWGPGIQRSQRSFKELIQIVGSTLQATP